ncbi:MAG: DUF2723 domain-containing protein [Lewinellaceae bacterium]|nr:DUF2723 domain-containing protein [Lewinellaceae bacterium]
MWSYKRLGSFAGWLVFAVAAVVYYFSAERTGSLWDCGEFILGAYKLQVVHPPGAPLFLLVGRIFAWLGSVFSSDPADIAFAVNLMSGLCTAFAAALIAWTTVMLGKLAMVGRDTEPDAGQSFALAGAGIAAGLATAFSSSIWFSAVEGEVYAMSTLFTTLTLWAAVKWYVLPDTPQTDRWLIFSVYAAGLSIGVHLLSILTFPALALLYYFKKRKNPTFWGMAAAAAAGVGVISVIQLLIIVGLPKLWGALDLFMVNSLGLPFNSGLIPLLLIVVGVIAWGLRYAKQHQNATLQNIIVTLTLIVIAYSTYGMVVTRANAGTPINMNVPSDAMRLIPYLNREQYGERALLRGPNFDASPIDVKTEDRYGRVGDRYEVVDQKISYIYADNVKRMLPRMGDPSQGRPELYKQWMGLNPQAPLPVGRPNGLDNFKFFWNYQLNWMYWRYFMWNFVGRQNGDQGYYPWDKSSGHWLSGIKFIDEMRLGNEDMLTDVQRQDPARNKYYFLPLLFGILGMVYQFVQRRNDFLALLALFIITGIGIIIYSNQPPNEPRERDYVLIGSFFTFCIWIGMGVLALFEVLRERARLSGSVAGILASLAVLSAPLLMGTQNFDDHSRKGHYASRDYASNFLESCAPNAVIFTYGDNDTYPLWYAQEVEGIRRDIRVVNLSLIAVDWYIDLLRRKINDSPPLKLTLSSDAYRGNRRNQVLFPDGSPSNPMSIQDFLRFIGEEHPLPLRNGQFTESYLPTKQVYLPVDRAAAEQAGLIQAGDTTVANQIPLNLGTDSYILKDELAILDIIGSNLWERPIYFAVTTRPDKLFGLQDYTQLEGLALRLTPKRTPSDPSFGLIGSGGVNTDAFYKNVMEKFRWGNFDKQKTFIDRSYTPSVQSIQLAIRRAAGELLIKEDKEKAIALIDRYFEAFPAFNFPYDYKTHYMLDIYLQAGAYDKAKPHLEILAEQTAQELAYYDSISPDILASSYQFEYDLAKRTMSFLLNDAESNKDEAFLAELKKKFAAYQTEPTENALPPQLQQQLTQ